MCQRILHAEGKSPKEIYRGFAAVYDKHAMNRKQL